MAEEEVAAEVAVEAGVAVVVEEGAEGGEVAVLAAAEAGVRDLEVEHLQVS